jgi:hypothetical protein
MILKHEKSSSERKALDTCQELFSLHFFTYVMHDQLPKTFDAIQPLYLKQWHKQHMNKINVRPNNNSLKTTPTQNL